MNRELICAAIILLGSISSFGCLAGVPVSEDPKTISVQYKDGTRALLTCPGREEQVCDLRISSGSGAYEFSVDFPEMGGIARLNYLHVTVREAPFVALVTTGYYCSRADNELLSRGGVDMDEVDSLECAVTFVVKPGARAEWDSVRLLPQRQIYLKLTETGGRTGEFFVSPRREGPAAN